MKFTSLLFFAQDYVSPSRICRLVSMLSARGSPARLGRVLLISLGITILPKSSALLTMPVAFLYPSPFLVGGGASTPRKDIFRQRTNGLSWAPAPTFFVGNALMHSPERINPFPTNLQQKRHPNGCLFSVYLQTGRYTSRSMPAP